MVLPRRPDEPTPEEQAVPPRGAVGPGGRDTPQRGPDGRFLPGNTLALTHGLRRQDDRDGLGGHLRSEVDAFVAGALRDENPATLSTRRRSLLEYRARIHRRVLQLDAALEDHGLLDRRHRLRATWLQRLESLISTAKGLDQTLGLETHTLAPPDLALVLRHHTPTKQ